MITKAQVIINYVISLQEMQLTALNLDVEYINALRRFDIPESLR